MIFQMIFEYEGSEITLPEVDELNKKRVEKSLPGLRRGDGVINAIDRNGRERAFKVNNMKNIRFKRIR